MILSAEFARNLMRMNFENTIAKVGMVWYNIRVAEYAEISKWS